MILIVDDDPDTTFLLTMHFERANLPVRTASTLAEARAALPEVKVVVCDRHLDGEDALELFRRGRPDNILVAILITGDEIPLNVVREARFDGVEKKPVDAQRIIQRCRGAVQ